MTRKQIRKTINKYQRTIEESVVHCFIENNTKNLKQFEVNSLVAITLELARLRAIDAIIEDDITDEENYNLKYISAVTEVTNMERYIVSGHSTIETVIGAMNRQYPDSSKLYIFNKKSTYDTVKHYLYLYYSKTHPKNK